MLSFTLSVVVLISLVSYKKKAPKGIMKNTIYKLSLICMLCNVLILCITPPKVYAQQKY